jgi:hypothetical protein
MVITGTVFSLLFANLSGSWVDLLAHRALAAGYKNSVPSNSLIIYLMRLCVLTAFASRLTVLLGVSRYFLLFEFRDVEYLP